MYADTKARGGVIEPEGVVEIKYRRPAIIATMDRLDQTLRDLKSRLNSPNLSSSESASINQQINDRIKLLYPVYSQMAVEFADLHDRAGRMKAKGVIRRELDWPSSRSFFYHRLVRRLNEDRLCAGLSQADPSLSRSAAIATLQSWFVHDTYDSVSLESGSSSIIASADFISNWESNDRIVTTWMTNSADSINSRIASIATLTKLNNLTADAELDPSFARQAILKLSSFLDDDTKSKLSSLL
ncbi:Acetyl-CoA carboxylase [Zancudomyces culisetae]|uniref:Acetyl-CoA carboxylase n=1 Tax=Zancudomyces culisetae TaxID=1213189 RepID=A0A1R1PDV3_ZANCU|nr:Acetyl-CoA carboxylase [Zancudomyces culisetae]|eukprot:OMH79146.1 Acetyl-CoA carboxylase [Zancudomyces culisetae]